MARERWLGLVADQVEGGGRQTGAQGVAVDDVFQRGGAKATGHDGYMGSRSVTPKVETGFWRPSRPHYRFQVLSRALRR
jgi:hypothetical protein